MSAGHPIDDDGGSDGVGVHPQVGLTNGLLRGRRSMGFSPAPAAIARAAVAPAEGRSTSSSSSLRHAVKRVVDVVLSCVALVVTAPLVALLMAIIRLDSVGPVLYRQVRVGRDGVPFELFKLRTMYDGQGVQATRIGRFLRPMGLDELPQFWNVLVGQMSIVGPRPERPHLVAEYLKKIPGYAGRHVIRPGITGWAQVHGQRGAGSIAERLRFDLEYVRTWSPLRDLWILLLSVVAVCRDTRRELRL